MRDEREKGGTGWHRRAGGMGRTLRAFAVAVLAGVGAVSGAEAQQRSNASGLGPSYSTFFIASEASGGFLDSRETLLGFGYLFLRGPTGGWALRPELAGGFVSGTRRTEGLLGAAQVGVSRVLTGDYLRLGAERALELYPVGVAGVVGSWAWSGEDEGLSWSPLVSAGVGGRLVDRRGDADFLSFEVLLERRTRFEGDRVFVRIATHRPRR